MPEERKPAVPDALAVTKLTTALKPFAWHAASRFARR
jgi:hypothetical protein